MRMLCVCCLRTVLREIGREIRYIFHDCTRYMTTCMYMYVHVCEVSAYRMMYSSLGPGVCFQFHNHIVWFEDRDKSHFT